MPSAYFSTLAKTKGDPIVAISVVVGFITFAVAVAIFASISAKKRRAKIALILGQQGYAVLQDPKDPGHMDAFGLLGPFMGLQRGAAGIRWSARGGDVTLVEHYYTTGGGKSTQHHYHTIAAVACPTTWPTLSIEPGGLLGKLAELFGAKDIKVENEAFNKRWRVKCPHEDFALLVLTPEIQQWFMSLPEGVGVRIGSGAAAVFKRRVLKPEELAGFAQLAPRLAAMIPPEIAQYGGDTLTA